MNCFQRSISLLSKFSSTELYNFQPVRLKSSKRWIQRQNNDHFVQKAASSNYRARSAFKLLEIEEKFSIFKDLKRKKSQVTTESDSPLVIDCGACPGGWSQVTVEKIAPSIKDFGSLPCNDQCSCNVISVDILEIEPISGVSLVQGDFMTAPIQNKIIKLIGNRKAAVILSDMAPSFTGTHSTDHYKTHELCLSVLEFSQTFLKKGGSLVTKYLMGEHENEYRDILKKNFKTVKPFKPKSSRKESTEFFFVSTGFDPASSFESSHSPQ